MGEFVGVLGAGVDLGTRNIHHRWIPIFQPWGCRIEFAIVKISSEFKNDDICVIW